MKIRLTGKIKNINFEIEDEIAAESLKEWRRSVMKELGYINKDIEEKGLETPENASNSVPENPAQPEPVKMATESQMRLIARLGITNISGPLTMMEADQLIKRLKEEQHWAK